MLSTLQKKVRPKLNNVFIILFVLYAFVGTLLYVFQESMIFIPTVLAQDYEYKFSHHAEELFLKTEENAVINALHFKVDNPKGVILYFHGNAGNLSRWGVISEYFVDKNYDVLIMDYRTYGKSKGKLSELAFYHDAQFCYEYLKRNYGEHQISVYGRSLGTALATFVAAKNSPKQLILETPYYSMVDIAHSRFPFFPTKYLLKFKFPNIQFIEDVVCPITMIHGTDDNVISIESAKKLYEGASNNQITLTVVKNGSHNNLIEFEAYHNLMQTVLP